MAKNPLPTTEKVDTSRIDEKERERRYRAKEALETIERAEGHRKDKDLMRDVKKLAKEKVKCLKNI